MSSTNLGNQNISYKYRQSVVTEELNKYTYKVIQQGLYQGGLLSVLSDVVSISQFIAFVQTSSGQGIRIETSSTIETDLAGTPTIPVTEAKPYITAKYVWANQIEVYLDFEAKELLDINSNDIVFGEAIFTTGSVTGFDYVSRTYGLFDQDKNVRAKTFIVNGDNGGENNGTAFTNVKEDTLSTGTGSIKLTGTGTTADNAGFIKAYIGTTPIYIPYFTDIAGS